MNIPKIEYDVYYKLPDNKMKKLNLSICGDKKIYLSVPTIISDDNLDKYNTSSSYYNDICYSTTSESGTDISLNDRKKEFVEGNKTICQEECGFHNYDTDTKKANCSCTFKGSVSSIAEMNFNKDKLYENLGGINNKTDKTNLGITKCNVLSSTENIKSNTGFFFGSYLFLFYS